MVPATTWARIASRPSLVAYTSVIPVYRLDVSLEYTCLLYTSDAADE